MFIIMFIVTLVFSWFMIFSVGGLSILNYWDAFSLVSLILFSIPMMVASGLLKDFLHACSILARLKKIEYTLEELERARLATNLLIKLVLISTVLIVSIFFIFIIRKTTFDIEIFLINNAVNTITVIYAMFFEMCLIPMEARLKKMILERKEKE